MSNGATASLRTIGSELDKNDGIGPGFDTLRVLLALAVILWHCFPLAQGTADHVKNTWGWALVYPLVPMFFALSGFLVTGSALRLTLGSFVAARALRIIPALAVDTLVTVLIFAPLLTTLPLEEFYSHVETYKYLLNIVGEIHYTLPGVFKDNPYPNTVNGSLWTIRPELQCYVAMAILIAFGWVRNWRLVFLFSIGAALAITLVTLSPAVRSFPAAGVAASPGFKLVLFFLLGSLTFLLKHKVPFNMPLFIACSSVVPIAALFGDRSWWENPAFVVTSALPLTYVVVAFGLLSVPKLPIFDRGDYSYGIYLYGFPIQQSAVAVFGIDDPLLLFATIFVPVVGMAMLSWHFVEKPALRLRKLLGRKPTVVAAA